MTLLQVHGLGRILRKVCRSFFMAGFGRLWGRIWASQELYAVRNMIWKFASSIRENVLLLTNMCISTCTSSKSKGKNLKIL
jgi:hypothetical protein